MMPHGIMGMDQMIGNKPESARTKEALARMVSNRIASGGRVSSNQLNTCSSIRPATSLNVTMASSRLVVVAGHILKVNKF